MISAEPTRLLLRDRSELDKVAFVLRGDRTVVAFIICAASLRPAVLDYMRMNARARVFPDPFEPGDAAAMHSWLLEMKTKPSLSVATVVIPQSGGPVMNALNLHREKLREGASKLIFVDGPDGFAALRAQGRDAYAFRDIVAYVQGEMPVPSTVVGPEPAEMVEARDRYARAVLEQADASRALAMDLRVRGDFAEAERLLRPCMELFTEAWLQNDEFSWHYARLSYELSAGLSSQGSIIEARRYIERALQHLNTPITRQGTLQRFLLLAIMVGPYGRDLRYLRLGLTMSVELHGSDRSQLFRSLTWWYLRWGNVREAARYLRQVDAEPIEHPFNRAIGRLEWVAYETARGNFDSAESFAREAVELFAVARASQYSAHAQLASAWFWRGETEATQRILTDVLQSNVDPMPLTSARLLWAQLTMAKGDLAGALNSFRVVAQEALAASADRVFYAAHADLVECLVDAHEAGRVSADELHKAIVEIENAEALSEAAFGTDPPWYTIFFPMRRSELVALQSTSDALTISQIALDRALASCSVMVPEAARVHGQQLVAAERHDEALERLALAEKTAREEEMLREVANAQRWSIVAAVRANKSAMDIEARMTAFRATLEESDSPRLSAEQLLDLARALPTMATTPDPLVLADEALDLFAEMPYPAKQARSMEVAGDILFARGDSEGAHRRYRAAIAMLEQFHLRLRIGCIEAKFQTLTV